MLAQVVSLPDSLSVGEGVLIVFLGTIPLMVAMVALVPIVIGNRRDTRAAKDAAQEASHAVNHNRAGEPRLYQIARDNTDAIASLVDSVNELTAWKQKWDTLPEELKNANALTGKLGAVDGQLIELGRRIAAVQDRAQGHAVDPYAHHQHPDQVPHTKRRKP